MVLAREHGTLFSINILPSFVQVHRRWCACFDLVKFFESKLSCKVFLK